MAELAIAVLGFALTLLVHATVLFGAVYVAERAGWLRQAAWSEVAWRFALVGSIVSATWASVPMERIGAWVSRADAPVALASVPSRAESMALTAPTPTTRSPAAPVEHEREATGFALPRQAIVLAAQAWFAGVCALWLLSAWRGFGVHRLMRATRGDHLVAPERRENEIAREVAARYGLDTPDLRFCDSLSSPVVLPGGAVLLPRWTADLPTAQLRALLAHELAHLQRRDPRWRVLHHVALAPLFLHPLAWLAVRRLDELAERQADAAAARLLGDGRPLAECLARCLEHAATHTPPAPRFALAMAEHPGAVVHRVRRLLEEDPMSHSVPSRSLVRAALALGLLAALALPSLAVVALADDLGEVHSVSIHSDGDDEEMTVKVRDGDYELDAELQGKITFADDETDVLAMAPGAEFELEETREGTTRRIAFSPQGDGVSRTYEVEGKAQAFDAAGRAWLAQALPDLFRRSGVDAQARAQRILRTRGVDGLLAEIALIPSDHARATYLGQLYAQATLAPPQQARALELTRAIDSDYELRRALSMALESKNVSQDQQKLMLELADQLDSDYERAELLIQAVAAFEIDGPMFADWSKAVEGIDSDYEHRRVLDAVLERHRDRPEAVAIALRGARSIGSDYERRVLLDATAGRALADPALRRDFLAAVDGIGSDYERKQALLTLISQGNLDAALAGDILTTIDGIGSDYEAKEALVALAAAMPGDARLIERYRQSARRLGDYERGQAEKALDRFAVL